MPDPRHTFTYPAQDLAGLAVAGGVRLNPVHSAVAHLLTRGDQPLISLELTNDSSAHKRLLLSVRVESYSDESSDTLVLAAGQHVQRDFFPTFSPEKIATITELRAATTRVRIHDLVSDRTLIEKTLPLDLLAVNSAPLAALDPATGQFVDQSRYFGAFVTPHDPEIEAFTQEAAQLLPAGVRFAGYQAADVQGQVRALYQALAARQTRYVDSTLDFNPSPQSQASQRVRLPRQSLIARQANCVDGTLLFASLLEYIGIEPALVILPRHMLLGWAPAKQSSDWRYLETTVLDRNSFEDAVTIGSNRVQAREQRQDATGEAGHLRRWPLRELRSQGIFPLPVTGDDGLRRIAQALEALGKEPSKPALTTSPPAPPPPSAAGERTVAQRVRRDALQRRLKLLEQQHDAASQQLLLTLDAAIRVILQGQVEALLTEMEQVEGEINALS